MSGFNARARYLTGLGISPSQAYRKRRLMAAYNPRVRYLRGFGDDSGITAADLYALENPSGANADVYGEAGPSQGQLPGSSSLPASLTNLFTYFTQPTVTPGSTLTVTPSTAASIANAMPAAAPSSNWFSAINPTFGVSNGVLVGGLGLLGALVLLSGGRRR